MNAEFETKLTLRGNNEELLAMLEALIAHKAFKSMVGYNTKITRGRASVKATAADTDQLRSLIEKGTGVVRLTNAYGVYGPAMAGGIYGDGQRDPFCAMADAAPQAEFEVLMEGNATYTSEKLEGSLKNGGLSMLISCWKYESVEETMTEAFFALIKEKLPWAQFVELFRLGDRDPEAYDEFIYDFLNGFDNGIGDVSYDEFIDWSENEDDLSEDDYEAALEQIAGLNLPTYEAFCDDFDPDTVPRTETRVTVNYNPSTGEYVKE